MSKGTKHRGIRIDDETWAEFQAATKAVGVNASELIRQMIRDWIKNQKGDKSEARSNDQ